MEKNKIISIIILVVVIMLSIQKNVYAANYSLNVEFDGKNIEMTSENPKMEWNVRNLYIGQPVETIVIINSTGSKEVEVELKPEIIDGTELGEIINLKIIKNQTNEIAYEGKYIDFQSVKTKISAKETNSFKVIVEKTKSKERDIQRNNCKIKFKIIATGEKNNLIQSKLNTNEEKQTNENKDTNIETGENEQPNEDTKNQAEKIATEEIKPIKKQQAYIMYLVLTIMVIVLGILVVQFIKTKK